VNRLVIVSNRLPVTVTGAGHDYKLTTSSGGLVSALRPIIRQHKGSWVGWTGTEDDSAIRNFLRLNGSPDGYRLVPVFLSREERRGFYCGFCNEIVWPLFHDLQSRCNFDPTYWRKYVEVNSRFAEVVCSEVAPADSIWVHDYHLMLQGRLLRERLDRNRLKYFHHIPFPYPDVFEKLPWRVDILESMLGFGEIAFQTIRDRRNFIACVRRLLPEVQVKRMGGLFSTTYGKEETLIGHFPVGIDFEEIRELALEREVILGTQNIRHCLGACHVVLGVDRLDYTKGIPEKLRAFRSLLKNCPELRGEITLVQIVVPSREDIPRYQELKRQVELLVSEINGQFGEPGWTPVHYLHRHLSRADLIAYYCAAGIALITPLKDGMNLVAKEFCASRVKGDGLLILSEFAGAASELRSGALLVNPYDTEAVAAAIYEAVHMDDAGVRERMRRMRRQLRTHNVYRWCARALSRDKLSRKKHVEMRIAMEV
jgi:trehalose 6-phosphate synthase